MFNENAMREAPQAASAGSIGGRFTEPIRQIDLAREAGRLRAQDGWLREGRTARTLVKSETLRIVLVKMRAGTRLGPHSTRARISLQAVAGSVSVRARGASHLLAPGQLIAFDAALPHDVEALEDSTFLLTLVREP